MAPEPSMKLSMQVNFKEPMTVFSLVLGGWFPLVLSSASVHVIDRNVLIWLRKASKGPSKRKDFEANRWWLSFLDSPTQRINPIHCAMEGPHGRVPTLTEFRDEYQRSCDEIQAYFPRATLIRQSEESFGALYEIVSALTVRHKAEVEFLCSVSPVIRERKAGKELVKARDCILKKAEELGFKTSITLLAVLSCLYEGASPRSAVAAKRVIYPKAVYTARDAHGALSDIRALELLGAGSALDLGAISVCTRDRPLAAFWCHLGIKRSIWDGKTFTISYDLSPQLFPVLSEEGLSDLFELLAVRGFVDRVAT